MTGSTLIVVDVDRGFVGMLLGSLSSACVLAHNRYTAFVVR